MNPKLKTPDAISPVEDPDFAPPFLGSWRRLYAVVLLELGTLIVLFYLFTKAFE
jgi:hypothetical protein